MCVCVCVCVCIYIYIYIYIYICSQDNFNCFYCTVLYAQILLVGNGRDMHLLVTMTYDLSDVYASDWSARRYDLTGDCDSHFRPNAHSYRVVTNQVFPTPGIKDPVLPTCVVFYVTPHVTYIYIYIYIYIYSHTHIYIHSFI